MPSSAQWMSSIAMTTGQRRLAASTSERTAEKRRSRICWGPRVVNPGRAGQSAGGSIPSGRAISGGDALGGLLRIELVADAARSPWRAWPTPAASRRCRRSRTGRGRSRRAPSRRARRRRRGSGRRGTRPAARARRAACANSRSSRDLPTPAWPMTRDEVGPPLAHDAVEERDQQRRLVLAADRAALAARRAASRACRERRAAPPPTRAPARPCPSASAARARSYSIAPRVRRWVRLADRSRCPAGPRTAAGPRR